MAENEIVFMGQPPMRVDFLRSMDGVTPEELFAGAVTAEIDGITIKVISREHLIANKRAAGRPQDLLDATFLERSRR
jgi:predicted nucleotidyltransferase